MTFWHCSNAREDVNLLQLQQLYSKVSRHRSLSVGSPTQVSYFQHWEQLSGEVKQGRPHAGLTIIVKH